MLILGFVKFIGLILILEKQFYWWI